MGFKTLSWSLQQWAAAWARNLYMVGLNFVVKYLGIHLALRKDGSVRRWVVAFSDAPVAPHMDFGDGVATKDRVIGVGGQSVKVRLFLPELATAPASDDGHTHSRQWPDDKPSQAGPKDRRDGPRHGLRSSSKETLHDAVSTRKAGPSSGTEAGPPPPPPGGRSKLPVVVFIHGGGFVFGSASTYLYDQVARAIARHTEALVVSVDYRLAPEHPYPAPYEDGLATLLWLRRQAEIQARRSARGGSGSNGGASGGEEFVSPWRKVRASGEGRESTPLVMESKGNSQNGCNGRNGVETAEAESVPLPLLHEARKGGVEEKGGREEGREECSDEDQVEPWLEAYGDLQKIVLFGDSAGANIAYNVIVEAPRALVAPAKVAGLILQYPFFSGTTRTASEFEHADGWILSLPVCDMFWGKFLPRGASRDHPACNPLKRQVLVEKLPPTVVLVAGQDLLHDRGEMFALALQRRKESVTLVDYPQAVHGFSVLFPWQDDSRQFLDLVKSFLHSISQERLV
eukprot:jgi/Mesen1/11069/ME000099S10516